MNKYSLAILLTISTVLIPTKAQSGSMNYGSKGHAAISEIMRIRDITEMNNVNANFDYCDQIAPNWFSSSSFDYYCELGIKKGKQVGFYAKKSGEKCSIFSNKFRPNGVPYKSVRIGSCSAILGGRAR